MEKDSCRYAGGERTAVNCGEAVSDTRGDERMGDVPVTLTGERFAESDDVALVLGDDLPVSGLDSVRPTAEPACHST